MINNIFIHILKKKKLLKILTIFTRDGRVIFLYIILYILFYICKKMNKIQIPTNVLSIKIISLLQHLLKNPPILSTIILSSIQSRHHTL